MGFAEVAFRLFDAVNGRDTWGFIIAAKSVGHWKIVVTDDRA